MTATSRHQQRAMGRIASLAVAIALCLPVLAHAQAGPVGVSTRVWASNGQKVRWPAIAYDSENRLYLAVSEWGGRIVGQLIDSAGSASGGPFGISNGALYAQAPRVAYSPDAKGFLVTWHSSESSSRAAIRGQIVPTKNIPASGLGTVISDSAYSTFWEQAPAVAYSTTSKRFLVTWPAFDASGVKDISARFVDNTGQPVGSGLAITTTRGDNDRDPTVGYIPDGDLFVIAWAGWDEGAYSSFVRYRTVTPTGTLGVVTQAAASAATYIPEFAYNTATKQLLLGWAQNDLTSGGIRLYGLMMSTTATLVSTTPTKFSAAFGAYDANSLAYNPVSGTFFVVTHGTGYEDAGVELTAAGVPANTGYGNLTTTGSTKGNYNPRIATNGCTASWVMVTAEAFANLYTQLVATPDAVPLGSCVGGGGGGGGGVTPISTGSPIDFSGDGKADLIWRNLDTGLNVVWNMDGATLTGASYLPTVPDTTWQIAGVTDATADGEADIFWRNTRSGDNALWYMNNLDITGGASLPSVVNTDWEIVGNADFNADGSKDLLWRHATLGLNALWYMNGTAISNAAMLPTVTDPDWQVVGAGDFNGDKKPDVVWRYAPAAGTAGAYTCPVCIAGLNVVWFMDGPNLSSYAFLPSVTDTAWRAVALVDLDGDGYLDVIWRNSTTGANAVWYLEGTTLKSSASLPSVPSQRWVIARY